jgi:hypothetical protein
MGPTRVAQPYFRAFRLRSIGSGTGRDRATTWGRVIAIEEAAVAAFGDDEFERLVLANMSRRKRDPNTWAVLVSPNVIRRTQATLVRALQRNAAALASRSKGSGCEPLGCSADAGERPWRRRARDFAQIVEAALTEVKAERRELEAAADRVNARRYREHLRLLASAIAVHQQHSDIAEFVAEEHDQRLWDLLDVVTVPHGPESEMLTLRRLTETDWCTAASATARGR